MTIVDHIRLLLASTGLTPKEYEALLLYDMEQMRLQIGNGNLSDRQVITRIAGQLTAGICGEVANQLAEILLGGKLGTALKDRATASLAASDNEFEMVPLLGRSACWGKGVAALQRSLSSYFGFGDAVYIVNIGGAHRFLLIKQGTTVEALQVWYDPASNTGYTLADWLTAANTSRLRRTVADFVGLLTPALAGNRERARELFQPIMGPFLGVDQFDLQGNSLSFAAVSINGKELWENLLVHHLSRVRPLD